MDINIFKPVALSLLVVSMFLPWVSGHMMSSCAIPSMNFSYAVIRTYNIAPLQVQGSETYLVNGESGTFSSTWPYGGLNLIEPQPVILSAIHPYYLALCLLHRYPWGVMAVSLSSLYCAYTLFACFAITGLLLTSVWTDMRRRFFWVSLGMLITGIVLFMILNGAIISKELATWQSQDSQATIHDVAVIPNIGICFALIGAMFLSLSYAHPKYVKAPIELRSESLRQFREKWLAVPDTEKFPIAFLAMLLLSWLFSSLASLF